MCISSRCYIWSSAWLTLLPTPYIFLFPAPCPPLPSFIFKFRFSLAFPFNSFAPRIQSIFAAQRLLIVSTITHRYTPYVHVCVCVCVRGQPGSLYVLVESACRLVYLRYLHAKKMFFFFIGSAISLWSFVPCLNPSTYPSTHFYLPLLPL